MLLKILIVIAVIAVVLTIVIALRPNDFTVKRTVDIHAPPAAAFAQVNDFHRWDAWSPWAKVDRTMKQTYEGAPSGAGAVYKWEGNSKVGAGRMAISESRADELVRIDLHFLKPFPSESPTEFTFRPEGDHTTVTWKMTGKYNFITKAIGLFASMDKLIGGDFEKGLVSLKAVAESPAAVKP